MEIIYSALNETNSTTNSTPGFGRDPFGGKSGPFQLLIVQILIIIIACRGLAWILNKVMQPAVIAEIIAGVLLGPSVMGRIPGYMDTIFPEKSLEILTLFAEVGLVFFMCLVGMELDFELMKKNIKSTFLVSLSGILLPFGISVGSSWSIYKTLEIDNAHSFGVYFLFMGVAMSITAFPVLARIIKEKQLMTTNVGVLTLSTAAWDDVAAWILLALSIGIMTGGAAINALWSFLLLIAYGIVMFLFGKWALEKILIVNNKARELTPFIFAMIILLILINAWLTEYFGLHAIFGAFIFGVCLPRKDSFVIRISEKFEDFILCFLLPIYFAVSGLKTKIDLINSGNAAGHMLLLICVAMISKIVGCALAARISKLTWRESLTLGVLMNCKGLVELIVLNIGLDNGIISEQVFTMMVVMAIVTTFVTSPIVHFLYPIDKVAKFESKKGVTNNITLAVNRIETCASMLKVASMIVSGNDPKDYNIYAIRSVGNQERPSAFMANPSHDEVLSQIEQISKLVDVQVKPLLVANDNSKKDTAKQICRVAKSKKTAYLILYWQIEEHDLENSTIGSYTIEHLISYSSSKGIVLIDTPVASFPSKINELVYVYCGTKYDIEATRVVRLFMKDSNIKLTVLHITNVEDEKDHIIDSISRIPNTTIKQITSDDPTQDAIDFISKTKKYWGSLGIASKTLNSWLWFSSISKMAALLPQR